MFENGETFYYHNSHIGTPELITNSEQILVWEANYDTFGHANVLLSTVKNNLRFAGQYFDAESGLHYSWMRYYDPQTGRYITSDPIGLAGGISTYAYALNNPVMNIDPTGEFVHAILLGTYLGGMFGAVGSIANQLMINGCVDWWEVGKDAAIGGLIGEAFGAAEVAAVSFLDDFFGLLNGVRRVGLSGRGAWFSVNGPAYIRARVGGSGELQSSFVQLTRSNIGQGTATNASSRDFARGTEIFYR